MIGKKKPWELTSAEIGRVERLLERLLIKQKRFGRRALCRLEQDLMSQAQATIRERSWYQSLSPEKQAQANNSSYQFVRSNRKIKPAKAGPITTTLTGDNHETNPKPQNNTER